MNTFIAFSTLLALASAGGIPQYSIRDIQNDRVIKIDRGISLGRSSLGLSKLDLDDDLSLGNSRLILSDNKGLNLGLSRLSSKTILLSEPEPQLSRLILSDNKGLDLGLSRGLMSKQILLAEPEPQLRRLVLSDNHGLDLDLGSRGLLLNKGELARTQIIRRREPITLTKTIVSRPVITKTLISRPMLTKTYLDDSSLLRDDSILLGKSSLGLNDGLLLGGKGLYLKK